MYLATILLYPPIFFFCSLKTIELGKCLAINVLTYSLALRPSDNLGSLTYGYPFLPINCLLLPSLNLHLS